MSTDITRGPKVCPSCGRVNSPNATHCWLCFTPLGGAIQTTTVPAPGEEGLSAAPYTLPTGEPGSGCSTAGKVIGVVVLVIFAVFLTVFLVCAAHPVSFVP